MKEGQDYRGILTLKYDHIQFMSLKQDISFTVDYCDISKIQKFPVDNDLAAKSSDDFIKANF